MSRFRIALLGKHTRDRFNCGTPELDRYLREQASQDMRRRVASCFVALDENDEVAGYYTLAATSLVFDQLSEERAKRLPRYPAVPAVLLGRLAVALSHQGQRLGGALVADALLRASRSEVMAFAMVVDAKDAAAARFYSHLGFEPLAENPGRLLRTL